MQVGQPVPCPVGNHGDYPVALIEVALGAFVAVVEELHEEDSILVSAIVACRVCWRHYRVTPGPGLFDVGVEAIERDHVCILGPVPQE